MYYPEHNAGDLYIGEKNIYKTNMGKKVLAVLNKMTKTGQATFWPTGLRWAQRYGQSHTENKK
jgi:hypothetical protein